MNTWAILGIIVGCMIAFSLCLGALIFWFLNLLISFDSDAPVKHKRLITLVLAYVVERGKGDEVRWYEVFNAFAVPKNRLDRLRWRWKIDIVLAELHDKGLVDISEPDAYQKAQLAAIGANPHDFRYIHLTIEGIRQHKLAA